MSWPNKYFLHSCSYRLQPQRSWAPSQYTNRNLFVRSRKISKPRDWYFKLSYRFEIWQAHRQHCCRCACQISERSDNSEYKSRGFETLRNLTERRLFGYGDGGPVLRRQWISGPEMSRVIRTTQYLIDICIHMTSQRQLLISSEFI